MSVPPVPPLNPVDVESIIEMNGYSSPEEALAAGKQFNDRSRAPVYTSLLAGRTLSDVQWNARAWLFEFSGPIWLLIATNESGIQWNVLRERPMWPAGREAVAPQRWKGVGISRIEAADWAAERVGRECVRTWAMPSHYLVYFRGVEILWFSPVRRLDTGEVIMHVFVEG